MLKNSGNEAKLRSELSSLGARDFEIVALAMNPERGLAALHFAVAKGVDRPVPYAIAIFDNPQWNPSGAKPRQATNVATEVTCSHCDGHRFVVVTDEPGPYGETWAPCAHCNSQADTDRWVAGERRRTSAQ